MNGVHNQIDEDLLHLIGIDGNLGQAFIKNFFQLDLMNIDLVLNDRDCPVNNVVYVCFNFFGNRLAGEIQQSFNDFPVIRSNQC